MAIRYLMSCVSQSNCQSLKVYMPDLVDLVLPLVPALIASELTQNLLLVMKDIVDCDALHRLSLPVTYATLRLYRTNHDIPQDWSAEELHACACRLTRILYDRSKIGGRNVSSQGKCRNTSELTFVVIHVSELLSSAPFSSACFCFLYPLLDKMLDGDIDGVEVDDNIMVNVLKIIKAHADRATDDGKYGNLY